MRVTLTAIDNNFHLARKPAQRKDSVRRGHRKYSKRSQKYHAEVVGEGEVVQLLSCLNLQNAPAFTYRK